MFLVENTGQPHHDFFSIIKKFHGEEVLVDRLVVTVDRLVHHPEIRSGLSIGGRGLHGLLGKDHGVLRFIHLKIGRTESKIRLNPFRIDRQSDMKNVDRFDKSFQQIQDLPITRLSAVVAGFDTDGPGVIRLGPGVILLVEVHIANAHKCQDISGIRSQYFTKQGEGHFVFAIRASLPGQRHFVRRGWSHVTRLK